MKKLVWLWLRQIKQSSRQHWRSSGLLFVHTQLPMPTPHPSLTTVVLEGQKGSMAASSCEACVGCDCLFECVAWKDCLYEPARVGCLATAPEH